MKWCNVVDKIYVNNLTYKSYIYISYYYLLLVIKLVLFTLLLLTMEYNFFNFKKSILLATICHDFVICDLCVVVVVVVIYHYWLMLINSIFSYHNRR